MFFSRAPFKGSLNKKTYVLILKYLFSFASVAEVFSFVILSDFLTKKRYEKRQVKKREN